jgi:hypothetical protein
MNIFPVLTLGKKCKRLVVVSNVLSDILQLPWYASTEMYAMVSLVAPMRDVLLGLGPCDLYFLHEDQIKTTESRSFLYVYKSFFAS